MQSRSHQSVTDLMSLRASDELENARRKCSHRSSSHGEYRCSANGITTRFTELTISEIRSRWLLR